jgi:hypothetical protein
MIKMNNVIEGLKQGFKVIDDSAESLSQLTEGIYMTERDIENIKKILKNALLGALIFASYLNYWGGER